MGPGILCRGLFIWASHKNDYPQRHLNCFLSHWLGENFFREVRMVAIWKGSIAFGLVNIPVELRTAVRADHISFRMLHKDDLSPIKDALLREAIRSSGVVGIGKIIIRQTQHLAGIKVLGDSMVLEIMRFANELVDANEYTFPKATEVRPQELKMAEQLIENLAEPFDPSRYTDDYRANLMKVIKAKMRGKKPKFEEPVEERDSGVLNLMSRLKASLEQGNGKKAGRGKRASPAAKPQTPRASKRKTA